VEQLTPAMYIELDNGENIVQKFIKNQAALEYTEQAVAANYHNYLFYFLILSS
jgi:hypothetical protein